MGYPELGHQQTGAEYVYDALVEAGIDLVVGLPGTQTLPLDQIVTEYDEMRYIMARHETAIPHMAWGYYESGGGVAATLTIPGPGDANVIHGLVNAFKDCVPIIHISADVNPEERGKEPIHEISPDTYNEVVKENINVEKPLSLCEALENGIETALTPPTGPVRIGVPNRILSETIRSPSVTIEPKQTEYDNSDAYEHAAELLENSSRPALYVGGGARRSPNGPQVVAQLADALSTPVLTTYKGKGVFPEDDPRFVGVTGGHLHAGGRRVLENADVVLALGTDFDGVTTAHWDLPMGERVIHVNLDPEDINNGYDSDVAIVDDVSVAGETLMSMVTHQDKGTWNGSQIGRDVRMEYRTELESAGLLDTTTPSSLAVLHVIREHLPREAIVTTDVGGHRLWAFQAFETFDRETYITAGSWAGMGVGLPAALGAKAANPDRPVVALTGDGGLMMCIQELHTAVEHELDVTIVVFNDSDYGIISQQFEQRGEDNNRRFEWDSPQFEAIAEGFGCHGTHVESVTELEVAIDRSLSRNRGPEVIDVAIQEEISPYDIVDYESTIEMGTR